jgi:hypothetical protein
MLATLRVQNVASVIVENVLSAFFDIERLAPLYLMLLFEGN